MNRQLGLFSAGPPGIDASFRHLRRQELTRGAWVDHAPSWVRGSDALFDALERSLAWRHETMVLYERRVAVPRAVASLPEDGAGHPLLEQTRRALDLRYGEAFRRVSFALYRDGNDSVAFHGDTTARDMTAAHLATVSLGAPADAAAAPGERGVDRLRCS